MMETKIIKNLMSVTLTGIADMKKIYITRQYPQITLNIMIEEINNKTFDKITPLKNFKAKRESSIILYFFIFL